MIKMQGGVFGTVADSAAFIEAIQGENSQSRIQHPEYSVAHS
jgi:hypothetical protein